MSKISQAPSGRSTLYQDVTDRVVRELEEGQVPWVQPWTSSGAGLGLPRSAATRRYYSGINVLILWSAVIQRGFASQEWLTYRQCLALGGQIRGGERGTTVCYADRFIPKAERGRAQELGEEPTSVPFLKRFTVFNVEQAEGLPPHIVVPTKPYAPFDVFPAAEALIAASGVAIREGGGEAYYHRGEDFIRVPPRAAFVSEADRVCTVLHELGHATAHPARLNRELQHRFGSTAYAREELIAELTSAFLCAQFGITPQIRHADYIGHWLQVLKADSRAIFHAASQASRACEHLLSLTQPSPIPPQQSGEQEP